MNRRIAPPLIEETTVLVQRREIVNICVGSQPLQAANLKVRPLPEKLGLLEINSISITYKVAVVVAFSTVIADEFHGISL